MLVPVIETPRLRLRSTRMEDADALHEMWSRPEVMAYLPSKPLDRAEVLAHLRRDREQRRVSPRSSMPLEVVVEDKASRRVVGWCGLSPLAPRPEEIELTCVLHPELWHRGYARESALAMLGLAFEILGLPRVLAVVEPGNEASRRAVRALGFHDEGLLEDVPPGHVLHGREVYVLSRRDWTARWTAAPVPRPPELRP